MIQEDTLDVKNQFERDDNFSYTEQVIDNKPDSEYLIMCANINHNDTWVWKFCVHEHNYTPVWSFEYGDCVIKGSNLILAMKQANEWINSVKPLQPKRRIYPELFLMKLK